MIPQNIKAIGGQQKRLRAVRDYITSKVQTDPLFITEALQELEPDRTMIFMALDGHQLNGGSPMVTPDLKIDQPPVRLMTVNENQTISVKERKEERVPGTSQMVMQTRHRPLGNDVMVKNEIARDLLYKYGFPTLDHRTRGSKKGFIVEVTWLESEVKKPDCLPELIELWERLQPRINAKKGETQSAKSDGSTKGKVS